MSDNILNCEVEQLLRSYLTRLPNNKLKRHLQNFKEYGKKKETFCLKLTKDQIYI